MARQNDELCCALSPCSQLKREWIPAVLSWTLPNCECFSLDLEDAGLTFADLLERSLEFFLRYASSETD